MRKVVYSVTKFGRSETKQSGIGYINDTDLVIACISRQGKPYIKVFGDCVKHCNAVHNKSGEYRGIYSEICEIETEKNDSFETVEIEVNYNIWYKVTD